MIWDRTMPQRLPWLGWSRFCWWSGTPSVRRVSGTLSSRYVADVKLASKLGVDTPGFKDISNWTWHSQNFENGGTPLCAHVTLRIRAQMKFDCQKRFGERLNKMLHNPYFMSFVYILIDRGWCKWSLTFDAEYHGFQIGTMLIHSQFRTLLALTVL